MTMPISSRIVDGVHPPPPISTPREAPWKEIEAIIDGLTDVAAKLAELIELLRGGGTPGQITVIIPHKATITTGWQDVATPGLGVQLPALAIQDGYPVTVVADPNNTGFIYLGKSQADLLDQRRRFAGLAPGLAVSEKIKNLSALWVDADVANDAASWIVETDT